MDEDNPPVGGDGNDGATANPVGSMNDAELAALVRQTFDLFQARDDEPGTKRLGGTAAALFLAFMADSLDADRLSLQVGAATHGPRKLGDWTILVLRKGEPVSEDGCETPPVTLEGWLDPEKVAEAIQCFRKLTTIRVSMSARD